MKLSALAAYSMLEDNICPTFAVPKSEISDLNLIAARLAFSEEEPACIIQEVSYKIPFEEQESLKGILILLTISPENKENYYVCNYIMLLIQSITKNNYPVL